MSIAAGIRLRPGYDQRYINIDVADVEVGHLRLAADGHVPNGADHGDRRPELSGGVSRHRAGSVF